MRVVVRPDVGTVSYFTSAWSLDSPIRDEKYKAWMARQLRLKSLAEVRGMGIEIEAVLGATSVELSGFGESMRRHGDLPPGQERLTRLVAGAGASPEATMAGLWRSILRAVRVPADVSF